MAMSLTGSGLGRGKNLTCGMCREVFRSPRLLPCFHTFCLYCVEGLARAHGGQSFPCPQCRKSTTVPPEGALGFQMNFYICEEELELERKGPSIAMCSTHDVEPLVFFCVQCDSAICIRCKLTKHEGHDTEDLSEAAARCQSRLETSKERLNDTISYLTRRSAEANDSIKAAKEKGIAIKQEVNAQRDALIAKVDKRCQAVLREVDEANDATDKQLTADAQKIQRELDSLLQLRQRVYHALGEASDAEKVCVEKEMRDGQGSEKHLDRVKECVPVTTVRPGLHYDRSLISEDDIRHFLGSPVQLSMPCAAASEVIVPIYRCGQDGACREVHSVCHVNEKDIGISFGGIPPDYASEQHISIDEEGNIRCKKFTRQRNNNSKVSLMKYGDNKCFITWHRAKNYSLNAKGSCLFRVHQVDSKTSRISINTVHSSEPLKVRSTPLFDVNSGKADAFDGTKDGQLFVIVEEKNVEQSQKTERTVLLFHRYNSDPFTTYTPSDAGFMPADVCFWQDNGQTKLLVADPQNDCVHVVNIEADRCRFERYLAAGSGDLVRPTALNLDDDGNVWIGCGNGWILKCEKHPGCEESPVEHDDESNASVVSAESAAVRRRDALMVENSSRPTDVQSQVSAGSAAVRRRDALMVENSSRPTDVQSQVSAGSAAVPRDDLLLVDNSSQSTDVQSQVSR